MKQALKVSLALIIPNLLFCFIAEADLLNSTTKTIPSDPAVRPPVLPTKPNLFEYLGLYSDCSSDSVTLAEGDLYSLISKLSPFRHSCYQRFQTGDSLSLHLNCSQIELYSVCEYESFVITVDGTTSKLCSKRVSGSSWRGTSITLNYTRAYFGVRGGYICTILAERATHHGFNPSSNTSNDTTTEDDDLLGNSSSTTLIEDQWMINSSTTSFSGLVEDPWINATTPQSFISFTTPVNSTLVNSTTTLSTTSLEILWENASSILPTTQREDSLVNAFTVQSTVSLEEHWINSSFIPWASFTTPVDDSWINTSITGVEDLWENSSTTLSFIPSTTPEEGLWENASHFLFNTQIDDLWINSSVTPSSIAATSRFDECNCGLSFEDKENKRVMHPWYSVLIVEGVDDRTRICGATLVSDRILVTAAECLVGSIAKIDVGLGKYNLSDGNETHSVWMPASNFSIHPEYSGSPGDFGAFNVAVVHLSSPVNFNDFVQPICMVDSDYFAAVGTEGEGVVWSLKRTFSTLMKTTGINYIKTKFPFMILANENCSLPKAEISPYHICAEFKDSIAFHAFSGEPLIVKIGEKHVLLGLSTFRFGNRFLQGPEAYLRLDMTATWINSFKTDEFCNPEEYP